MPYPAVFIGRGVDVPIQYIRQLQKRWGSKSLLQFVRMLVLHRTPFEDLLQNIFDALDTYKARFAFPIVASIARMRPDLVHMIMQEGHEVASHGFNHLRYPQLSPSQRKRDLKQSIHTFARMGVSVKGFRAPYDNYSDDMPAMIDEFNFVWDGGFGYRPEHRTRTDFFRIQTDKGKSRTTFIPLNYWSDDRMIDKMRMSSEMISKILKAEIQKVALKGGVVMFDLHPIRIGQSEYVGCLRDIVEYTHTLGGWVPTPSKAVSHWNKNGSWKSGTKFCLLLTGDIDNWVFSDYLRRQILKLYDRG